MMSKYFKASIFSFIIQMDLLFKNQRPILLQHSIILALYGIELELYPKFQFSALPSELRDQEKS